ncbi:hypothetical protein CJ738_35415, partial [Klebsiella pneumoniae]
MPSITSTISAAIRRATCAQLARRQRQGVVPAPTAHRQSAAPAVRVDHAPLSVPSITSTISAAIRRATCAQLARRQRQGVVPAPT